MASDIINILPDSVANQIAAGEVVDRPASAVKELLENALDAGATRIQLLVKDGGRTLIQVTDNGCGMSERDARLCFERHATSKIHAADDLFALHTMGFRGEALASIAAVAQVELRTRTEDDELGTMIKIEGSRIVEQTQCTCPAGTSIAVKNLFFNIPARRNFLKRDNIELSHIEEVFKRVALVNHDVEFSFYAGSRPMYNLLPSNFAERIAQVFGNQMREHLYPVGEDTQVAKIHGYVSKPEYARKSRGEQYLFVNHRFIKHPALSAAIEKAYTDLIPEHYYPGYFLLIDIDPSRIDVNIHPTKTEVKFIDEQSLFAILRAATKKALGQFGLATELEFNPSTDLNFPPPPKGYTPPPPTVHYNSDYNPFSSGNNQTNNKYHQTKISDQWRNFFEDNLPTPEEPKEEALPLQQPERGADSPCLLLQQRYIVSTLPSGLLVIDIPAAHERILYERLLEGSSNAAPQQLLFPANCSFSPADAEIFIEILPDLKERGFEISPLGNQIFVVTATPPDMRESGLQDLFDQLLTEYKSSMLQKFNDRTQSLCRSLARRMAMRPGVALQQDEMQQIVADLFCCKMPHTSPSGKKTLIITPPEKLFN